MNTNLKEFRIDGLFGTRNISISFDDKVKILIGENGLGKTTFLNALYFTITCQFQKLKDIVFSKITISFATIGEISFCKEDLNYWDEDFDISIRDFDRFKMQLSQYYSPREFEELMVQLKMSKPQERARIVDGVMHKMRHFIPPNRLHRYLMRLSHDENPKIEEVRIIIKNEIKEEVLYFPTYRRIEEDLQNLGTGDVKLDRNYKRLIQFGMDDVNETIRKVVGKIKNSSIEGFSEITGEMLSQYVDGLNEINSDAINMIKPEILTIILERVGKNISTEYKTKISQLVTSGEIFNEQERYKYLINFLTKLIRIYEQHKHLDNQIKDFATACNNYLLGKKVVYNESKVSIKILKEKSKKEIKLKNLSSGEKQIISLFTKIYLDSSNRLIVLFDEPELSLSIEWQEILLPDILKSDMCDLLLAVTHSPFIFDNELREYSSDMNNYVTELEEDIDVEVDEEIDEEYEDLPF